MRASCHSISHCSVSIMDMIKKQNHQVATEKLRDGSVSKCVSFTNTQHTVFLVTGGSSRPKEKKTSAPRGLVLSSCTSTTHINIPHVLG